METVESNHGILKSRIDEVESEERKRIESIEERHGKLIETVESNHGILKSRIDGVESIGRRHGKLIDALDSDQGILTVRVARLEAEERTRIGPIETRNGKLTEGVKSASLFSGGTLAAPRSSGCTRIASPERQNSGLIGAVKSGGVILPARADPRDILLPPHGPGVLGFLKRRNYTVTVTVSSTYLGSTDDLLTDNIDYWISRDVPNSWIQWTIGAGLKAVISSVKIIGGVESTSILRSGVKDFIIEGSNGGALWTKIIDSKTCPTLVEPCVTLGESLSGPLRAFSMIRLTQTGPRYCPKCEPCHNLALSYVDFAGTVIFPVRTK
jgi:hypothetical protein